MLIKAQPQFVFDFAKLSSSWHVKLNWFEHYIWKLTPTQDISDDYSEVEIWYASFIWPN